MTQAIKHRGSDGIAYFSSHQSHLSNLKLIVSPESKFEQQPFTSVNRNTITADARIDNRAELIAKLNLIPQYADCITDSEIILACYEFWGEDCLFHLVGDFAFAIWDEAKQQIFCGRDHLGARPFYYFYEPSLGFVFASEIKALLTLDFVPKDFNLSKIADYLSWLSDTTPYTEYTFYKEIKALKPAFSLIINKNEKRSQFCWNFNLSRFSHLKNKKDFVDAFRNIFEKAVIDRSRSLFAIASHLSGGLDSSSIVCVLEKKSQNEIITLHDDTGYESTNEKKYAEAVVLNKKLTHFWVKPKEDFYESLACITEIFDRPEHFNVVSQRQLAQAEILKENKCRILFSGHDGDTVLSYGTRILTKLLREENWIEFNEKLTSYVHHLDYSYNYPDWEKTAFSKKKKMVAIDFIERLLIEYLKEKKISKAVTIVKNTSQYTSATLKDYLINIIYKVVDRFKIRNKFTKRSILGVNLIKNHIQNEYNEEAIEGLSPQQTSHFRRIYSSGIIDINEQFNHIGAYHSFIPVFPFLSKELIELCLVIPAEYNFGNGKLRDILRESMKDILPHKVYIRVSKADLSDYVYQIFTKNIDFIKYCDTNKSFNDWVDMAATKRKFRQMEFEKSLEKKYSLMWKICRVPYLIEWLNQNKK